MTKIVITGSGTGTISNVTIQHNLFMDNYYSGIRFSGAATQNIVVVAKTSGGEFFIGQKQVKVTIGGCGG